VIGLVLLVLSVVATVKIVVKAGYSGVWVLCALLPIVNIVLFFVFAFSDWPVLQAARAARRQPQP
jgi:hypothetical protein